MQRLYVGSIGGNQPRCRSKVACSTRSLRYMRLQDIGAKSFRSALGTRRITICYHNDFARIGRRPAKARQTVLEIIAAVVGGVDHGYIYHLVAWSHGR